MTPPLAAPHPVPTLPGVPPVHPARALAFDDLAAALDARVRSGAVARADDGPLALYIYTNRCVYDDLWDDVSILARGLVLHHGERRVVATPFPKFFNYGERGQPIPDEPFEVYEKLDGSMAVLFHDGARWRVVTKGAFDSAQARWAEAWLGGRGLEALSPGSTYLFEAIYPENRVVVRYDRSGLVLLAAYDDDGKELSHSTLGNVARELACELVQCHTFASLGELVAMASTLPRDREGFVLRFDSGLRLKLKGEAYRRIHALLSDTTPLGLWRAMEAGDDLSAFRREIPEEFWSDFDAIHRLLQRQIDAIVADVEAANAQWASTSDRDLGLAREQLAERVRPFVFTRRKRGSDWHRDPASRRTLFRMIRPVGNALPGYTPSTSILGATAPE